MINKILRKTSNTQKRNPYSYIERGREKKKWKAMTEIKIEYLKEGLRREIEAYIREHGISNIEDTERGEGVE